MRFAILSDDVKTLSKAPGIGKKTAQKLILELKDKMKLEDAFELKLAHEQERAAVGANSSSVFAYKRIVSCICDFYKQFIICCIHA